MVEKFTPEQVKQTLERLIMIAELLAKLTDNPLDNIMVLVFRFLISKNWFITTITIIINTFLKQDGTFGDDGQGTKVKQKLLEILRNNDV